MKKKSLLMLLAAVLLPLSMGAQLMNAPQANGLLQRSQDVIKSWEKVQKSPSRASLEPNQRIMGHYDTDDVVTGGYLGLTGFPGVIPTAIEITPSELAMFQGGKIVAFRVGLAAATPITRVFVAPSTSAGLGEFTEWTCNASAEGWNVIPVDPPYEINLDENTGLFIGYDYKQTSSNYPISAVEVGELYPTYMYLTYQGSTSWYDLGLDSYGNLSLQCIVENDNYPDYMINVASLNCNNYIKAGDALSYAFRMRNQGTKEIAANAVTYNVLVDGEVVETLTNDQALSSDYIELTGNVATDGMASGAHVLSIEVVGMEGVEATISPSTLEATFKIYENSFPHQKHLIEEFTSNSCTYCPLGASMLHKLMDIRDDIAMVAIHGNQSSVDPCNTAQCDTLFSYMGAQGWPYGAFNRSTGWEDDANIACGIGYYEEYHQQVAEQLSLFLDYLAEATPCFATIEINGTTDMNERKLYLEVHGDMTPDFDIMMGEDAKLTVYLTEDSLVYRQLNQGKWISDYVHNHVLRLALGSVKGVEINKVGDSKYSNTFVVDIPAEWNIDKLDVVAFISRPLANGATGVYTDMYVNNANSIAVNEISAGVEEILVDGDAVPVGYYDVTGRQHDSLQPGINIVKMSNGTAKKVFVK